MIVGDLPAGVVTALLPLLTAGVLATAKFLADVRRQLTSFRQLLLGYEDQGGGLIDQVRGVGASREKLEQDLNAAWARIRELERVAGIVHAPFTTTERSAP